MNQSYDDDSYKQDSFIFDEISILVTVHVNTTMHVQIQYFATINKTVKDQNLLNRKLFITMLLNQKY